MSEQKESLLEIFGMFRKFNPVVLLISFALMNVFAYVFNSQMQLDLKLILLALSFFFLMVAVTFEFHRLDNEKEIFRELQQLPMAIPWVQKVPMVKVTDA